MKSTKITNKTTAKQNNTKPPKSQITNKTQAINAMKTILGFIDNNNKFTQGSAERIIAFYEEFFHKYNNVNINSIIQGCKKLIESEGLARGCEICFDDIDFTSFCEHHLLKFEGTVSIKYKPNKYIVGFDRISYIVDFFASRPNLQERMMQNILNAIVTNLSPLFCSIKIVARHDCMAIRGQKKTACVVTTSQDWIA